MIFDAHEYDRESMRQTGKIETYFADDARVAALACKYAHALKDGAAKIGSSGRVVHVGRFQYVLVPRKPHNPHHGVLNA